MTNLSSVIINPVVTEKTSKAKDQYTFVVDQRASKTDISAAIKTYFKVKKVASVNTAILPSKSRMTKFGKAQKRSIYKKAIVTVGEGETINFNDFK